MKKNDFVYIYRTHNREINAFGTCLKTAGDKAYIILENGNLIIIDILDTVYEVLI